MNERIIKRRFLNFWPTCIEWRWWRLFRNNPFRTDWRGGFDKYWNRRWWLKRRRDTVSVGGSLEWILCRWVWRCWIAKKRWMTSTSMKMTTTNYVPRSRRTFREIGVTTKGPVMCQLDAMLSNNVKSPYQNTSYVVVDWIDIKVMYWWWLAFQPDKLTTLSSEWLMLRRR